MSNLNPDQFIAQHAAFHKWTRQEEQRVVSEHTTEANGVRHASFPRDAGRRVSQLRGARTWLEDTYSEAAHEAMHSKQPFDKTWVAGPLHGVLDERHHPLVDEFLRKHG